MTPTIPSSPEEPTGAGVAYLGVDPGAEGGLAAVRRSALDSAYRGVRGLSAGADVDIRRRPAHRPRKITAPPPNEK